MSRRKRRAAPSLVPDELKMVVWVCVLFGSWLLFVFAMQAANAAPARANAAITAEVCAAHAAADGWDL